MKRKRSSSPQTTAVVLALAADRQAWRHGYDLCQETGLKAGTMYPILIRLADQGFLETAWEHPKPGRPPRHLYRLTGMGRAFACDLAKRTGDLVEAKAPRPRLGLEGTR